MIIFLFFLITVHLTDILAINTCERYNITHFSQDDCIILNFLSHDILKLDRNVRCNSSSTFSSVNGCTHRCTKLDYGQSDQISIELRFDNGTQQTCSIDYTTSLQAASLAYLTIADNKVQLGVNRPTGSFDYVEVYCPDEGLYIIFNASIPSNNFTVTVNCAFLVNTSLMSFVFRTIKKGFQPVANNISREVPLPILFTHTLNKRLLAVNANALSPMNTNSTYEFLLLFHDPKNESFTHRTIKVSNLDPKLSSKFTYGLIPNLEYTILFKHIVQSMGYAQSNITIPPIVDPSYPMAVTNLRVKEEYNTLSLNWDDHHYPYDPVEYIVSCNSHMNSRTNVGRNTMYTCEQMTFNDTDIVSVQTQAVLANYTYDQTAVVQLNVSQIPELPTFEVTNTNDNSITIRWNSNQQSSVLSSFRYRISCSPEHNSIEIDIQSNEYRCQSLMSGTLYVITMLLETIDHTIQRSRSILANTLLEKCQYHNHFYSPDLNHTRSVIIEWSPPEKTFDQIQVHCSSSYITFELLQIMPVMFVKCLVTDEVEFTVSFVTIKSGYQSEVLELTDIPPVDSITTSSERAPSTDAAECGVAESQTQISSWRTVAIVALIVAGFLLLVTIGLTVLSFLLHSRQTDE